MLYEAWGIQHAGVYAGGDVGRGEGDDGGGPRRMRGGDNAGEYLSSLFAAGGEAD